GTEGEYIYPCPMDERLLEFTGISSNQFTAAVSANLTDEGVAAWFKQAAKPHTPIELEEWNGKLLARGPSSPESAEKFKKYMAAIAPARRNITGWPVLQDLKEGRAVPRRELRHPPQ